MTTKKQMIIAAAFHIVFICLSFLLMQRDPGVLLDAFVCAAVCYWIFWITSNRRSYMPWKVFLVFLAGAAVQFIINMDGWLVPEDEGFLSGIGQAIYQLALLIHTGLLLLSNGIMWLINRKKSPKNEKSAS